MKRWEHIVSWVLQVPTAAFFLYVGIPKLRGSRAWIWLFHHWGYPNGFYWFVGVLEVGGALLLVIPRTAAYGAALLAAVMICAAITNLSHHEPQYVTASIAFVAAASILWLRRRSLFARAR